MIRNTTVYMEKRRSLSEMRIRVENLKKKFGREYVDITMKTFNIYTSNELDLLYLTYFHIKDVKVRYNRYQFGTKPIIAYELNDYLKNTIHSSWGSNNKSYSTVDGEWKQRRVEIENHWNRLSFTEPNTDPYANVLYTYM